MEVSGIEARDCGSVCVSVAGEVHGFVEGVGL
jgi:hypothetical protein